MNVASKIKLIQELSKACLNVHRKGLNAVGVDNWKQVLLVYNADDTTEAVILGAPGEDVLEIQRKVMEALNPGEPLVLEQGDNPGINLPPLATPSSDESTLAEAVEVFMGQLKPLIKELDSAVARCDLREISRINRTLQALAAEL